MTTTIKAGDKVRVGKGKTVWSVQELWNGSPITGRDPRRPLLATLHSGWNSTTVAADRLVKVEDPS